MNQKLKCPRCKNEKLKGAESYCPICGFRLKERTAQEVSVQEQLKNLHKLNITGEDIVKLDNF